MALFHYAPQHAQQGQVYQARPIPGAGHAALVISILEASRPAPHVHLDRQPYSLAQQLVVSLALTRHRLCMQLCV